jgi:NAD(P)-dependent dehydrogenase (short-subunit alcohol dehydrogenase family)
MTDTTVAFITGANRGLGLATARELAKQGITVVIGARDLARGRAAAEALQAEGLKAEALSYDGADPRAPQAVAEYLARRFGKLDILVNNAGTMKEQMFENNAASVPTGTLRATFETNFFAVVELTQALLPLIRKSPAGRIVNLSSILGSLTVHSLPDSPIAGIKALGYDASKTALNAFTVHLAALLQDTAIKVNSAHPGWVKTDMGGEQAPMEIADGVKTSVRLATLPADGPTGGFFHMEDALGW